MFSRPPPLLLVQQQPTLSASLRWPFLSIAAVSPFFSAPVPAPPPSVDRAHPPHSHRRLLPPRRPLLVSTLAAADPGRAVTDFLTGPLSEQLTFGGVTGFATGYALSRLGRLALLAVGIQILSLQAMAHRGWVSVHWSAIAADVDPSVRAGRHGGVARVVNLASYRVPFAGAFTAVREAAGRRGGSVGGRGWTSVRMRGVQRDLTFGGWCAGAWFCAGRADGAAATVGDPRWGRRSGWERSTALPCGGFRKISGRLTCGGLLLSFALPVLRPRCSLGRCVGGPAGRSAGGCAASVVACPCCPLPRPTTPGRRWSAGPLGHTPTGRFCGTPLVNSTLVLPICCNRALAAVWMTGGVYGTRNGLCPPFSPSPPVCAVRARAC